MDTYESFTNPADREKLYDLLLTAKHFAGSYNTFTSESSNKSLRQDLLTMLEDEHTIEFRLFDEMQKRGWYTVEFADRKDIDLLKQNYDKKMI